MSDVMAAFRADCSRCTGLCCVGPQFVESPDFAFTKGIGVRCRNLLADDRCGVHTRLLPLGMRGCVTFDCLGAGPHVVNTLMPGEPHSAQMYEVFAVVRQLHLLLWYLTEACLRAPTDALEDARAFVEDLTVLPLSSLVDADVDSEHMHALLLEASETVRAEVRGRSNFRGADLRGERLVDLYGANLRGTRLGDLRDADLRLADLRDASLRDADLRGADLSTALFVTQGQLDEAHGDASSQVPSLLLRPSWW